MKESLTEVTSTSISSGPIPATIDEIVSHYERELSQSISTKIIAAQNGPLPVFTKEETAYLNKKANEENQLSDIKVLPSDPTITLKNGNTEINIHNAAILVKKMEKISPSSNKVRELKLYDEKVDELIEKLEQESEKPVHRITPRGETTMRETFQQRVNMPTTSVSPDVARCVAPDEKTFQERFSDIKTVNKNAYEIRTDVLAMALDWVKFKTTDITQLSDDEVLNTAQKFYKFVEDRRRSIDTRP